MQTAGRSCSLNDSYLLAQIGVHHRSTFLQKKDGPLSIFTPAVSTGLLYNMPEASARPFKGLDVPYLIRPINSSICPLSTKSDSSSTLL